MKTTLLLLLTVLATTGEVSAQVFRLDAGHTSINFTVNRFGIVDVVGRFPEVTGQVTIDSTTGTITAADLEIAVAGLESDNAVRDGHLKGRMWLNADAHPTINFVLDRVATGENGPEATGAMTIRGVTREITFPFRMSGPYTDPTGKKTVGIAADLSLNRQDYGIRFSKLMDNGELLIGNEVRIQIRSLWQD